MFTEYLTVQDLSREQLVELKEAFFEQYLQECAEDDPEDKHIQPEGIPDTLIFEHYDGIMFSPDDFWCSCGED